MLFTQLNPGPLRHLCCICVQNDYSDELKKESAAIKNSADLNTAAASLKLQC